MLKIAALIAAGIILAADVDDLVHGRDFGTPDKIFAHHIIIFALLTGVLWLVLSVPELWRKS